MSGWLDRFTELGLVRRDGDGWARADRLRVASVPERHAYVDAVTPTVVDAAADGRTVGWEPDPLFDVTHLRSVADDVDVVHLHFGFEHLAPDELGHWLDALRELRIPLVLTVHDLRNPHLTDNVRHDAHLHLLTSAAAEVLTLTDCAAARIRTDHGRDAVVVPHPTVIEPAPGDPQSRTVLVPLGALRNNVQDVGALLQAAVLGAGRAGGRVLVDLRPGLSDPRAATARALAADGLLDLVESPRRSDAELAAHVAAARVLVLPYRFGTHSGWIELATDLGVRPVVPSGGCYAAQSAQAEIYRNDERDGLDAAGLADAVERALTRPRPEPAERAERLGARAHARSTHEIVYRRVVRA